jgi:hypothetical protein
MRRGYREQSLACRLRAFASRPLDEGTPWSEVLPELTDAMVSLHAAAPTLHHVLFEETRLPPAMREEFATFEKRLVDRAARPSARVAPA